MRCGLFGKLVQARLHRLATPRSFLEAWEPWVQSSLSASRHQLGDPWQQAFLTAPVWRFWLGRLEFAGNHGCGCDHVVVDAWGATIPSRCT